MMYVVPRRSSWIWSAPETVASLDSSVSAPRVRRNWSEVRPSPWTTALAWTESVSREPRAIQPILRWASTPSPRNSARALTMKSPFMRFHRKCPSSEPNHMLAPAPEMTSEPSSGSAAAEPGRTTGPMSSCPSKRVMGFSRLKGTAGAGA